MQRSALSAQHPAAFDHIHNAQHCMTNDSTYDSTCSPCASQSKIAVVIHIGKEAELTWALVCNWQCQRHRHCLITAVIDCSVFPCTQATVNLATETALVRAALADEATDHAERLQTLGKELTEVCMPLSCRACMKQIDMLGMQHTETQQQPGDVAAFGSLSLDYVDLQGP